MKLKRLQSTTFFIICSFLLLITVLPLILMLINSFKSRIDIANNPLSLPFTLEISNYISAWKHGRLGSALYNSLFLTFFTLIITIITSCMSAYALTKKRMRYWKGLSIYFLICNTIPKQLFIIPLFFILQRLNLINSRMALAFIYSAVFTPFAIFLLRTYFLQINPEIENSALMDGANSRQIFIYILMPIVQPGILTVSLIVGLWCWNEFLFAVTFLQNDNFYTVSVRFYSFTSRYVTEWGNMMAFAVIITVPIIIFFVFLQKKFISGMTAGGVKG